MLVLWLTAMVLGLTVSVLASGHVVTAASRLAARVGISPFVIGVTIVAVGTDLPEIANSISASLTGHGDVNVGDSVGSAVTQLTLVLGVLCLVRPIRGDPAMVLAAGALTVWALALGAALLADRGLSRIDGVVLVASWVGGAVVIRRVVRSRHPDQQVLLHGHLGADLARTVAALGLVGAGAITAVLSFTRVAESLGVPEYASSLVGFSIGTSLPELVVGLRALTSGRRDLALGDIMGSSFADATLSLGAGPLVAPIVVSAQATAGSLAAAAIVAAAVAVLSRDREHSTGTGVMLLGLYLVLYAVVLV